MNFKWVLIFYFLLANSEASVGVCSISEYQYNGTFFSDSFQSSHIMGQEACHERQKFNAKQLDSDYKENKKKINDQIENIINDPVCEKIKEPVIKYKNNLKKHFDSFQARGALRLDLVTRLLNFEFIDKQREYAYIGAYRATCLGEENNINSFVDLDAINEISAKVETPTKQIKKDGEAIDDCANVEAQGNNDLNGFSVSMTKALNNDFNLSYDFYSAPDQIILKNSDGTILHDSGCIPTKDETSIKILLNQLTADKKVFINIINNCKHPEAKGGSAWRLGIKCQSKATSPCQNQLDELISSIKKEIRFTKELTELDVLEMQCLIHYDRDILKAIERDGLMEFNLGFMKNINCDLVNNQEKEKCIIQKAYQEAHNQNGLAVERLSNNAKTLNKQNFEIKHTQEVPPNVLRVHSKIEFDRAIISRCSAKPKILDSVLKHISWSYCDVGYRKLEIKFD